MDAAASDPELAAALAMSLGGHAVAGASHIPATVGAGAGAGAGAAGKMPVAAAANDARLKVDQTLLAQLLDFGFAAVRAEKALVLTQNKSLDAAMDWLTAHEGDADIDQPLQIVGVGAAAAGAGGGKQSASALLAAADAAKPKWKPGEKGAPLGWKEGDEYEDDEDSMLKKFGKSKTKLAAASMAAPASRLLGAPAAASAASTASSSSAAASADDAAKLEAALEQQFQSQFGAQTLTKEEKLARLDQLRAENRRAREEAERKNAQARELARIQTEKGNLDLRRQMGAWIFVS